MIPVFTANKRWSVIRYFGCFIVLSLTVCTVRYVCLFCGDQIFVDFVSFLCMIIYKVLYTDIMFKA